MSLQNRYHRRLVAESASKPCLVCYKPSSTVLVTPDNADLFYTCPGHLDDKGFAEPVQEGNSCSNEKKVSEDLEKEIEQVKKEYEEKIKKRKGKNKGKTKNGEDDGSDKKSQMSKDEEHTAVEQETKERDDKIESLEQNAKGTSTTSSQDNPSAAGPRIYILHR
ncbi:MAG: hypothetical protein M1831_003302 [Alyxoria varia]|nr:MAG: hypothetical protein M1831_003302 [Alyxoria varia]